MTVVSVCIPTRNQAPFLRAAIESALAQDLPGLEVLVHDDASTDATPQVLAAIRDPRRKEQDLALGVSAAQRLPVGCARPYIARPTDDTPPGSLAPRVAPARGAPARGLVHPAPRDGRDRACASRLAGSRRCRHHPARPGRLRELITSNLITTSTAVVRRSAHQRSGGFSTRSGRRAATGTCGFDRAACRCAHPTAPSPATASVDQPRHG
jgi:glycosyltransferase involved in cell wall biosynthesis